MLNVKAGPGGKVVLTMGAAEAEFLRALPARARAFLENPEARERIVRRLFPPAYRDEEKEAEYRRLLGDDLRRRKIESVEIFERTLAAAKRKEARFEVAIRPEEFEFWLGFVNDLRILLGMELDITDESWEVGIDPDDPRALDLVLLHSLSWLEERLLRASGFPGPKIKPGDVRG